MSNAGNVGNVEPGGQRWSGRIAPGLEGIYGRLRIAVGGRLVATLVVEGTSVALVLDIAGPADATVLCADGEAMRKLLRGELNPFIPSMQRRVRLAGDRGFGARVMLGLQAGSPFATDAS